MTDVQTLPPPQYPSLTSRRQEVEYVVLAEADSTASTSFHDYLRLFWRRKWLFLLPALCILPWVGLLVVTQPSLYGAKATVLIEDRTPAVVSIPEVAGPEQARSFFYSTQYEVIRSRALAEAVIEKLQLYTPQPAKTYSPAMATLKAIRAFPERVWQAVLASVTPRDPEDPAAPTGAEASSAESVLAKESVLANQQRQRAVGRLLAALKVKPRKVEGTDTKLVDIIVEVDSPNQAVRQVNAVAAVYVQQNLDKRLEASRKATVWL